MVKYISLFILFTTLLLSKQPINKPLQKDCLACHIKYSIPSEMIYRRYLMKYSSKDRIRQKIFEYIKNPNQEKSIMPKPFFLKFKMKESSLLNDIRIKEQIDSFILYYDVKERFFVPTSSLAQ